MRCDNYQTRNLEAHSFPSFANSCCPSNHCSIHRQFLEMKPRSEQPALSLLSTVYKQLFIRRDPPRLSTTITAGPYSFSTMSSPSPSSLAMPPMLYGTAWKKDRTADLVYRAIKSGFRGIDTAAMKRHYDEALTGEGIRRAINEGIVTRGDLWVIIPSSPFFFSHSLIHNSKSPSRSKQNSHPKTLP